MQRRRRRGGGQPVQQRRDQCVRPYAPPQDNIQMSEPLDGPLPEDRPLVGQDGGQGLQGGQQAKHVEPHCYHVSVEGYPQSRHAPHVVGCDHEEDDLNGGEPSGGDQVQPAARPRP